jgi:phosphatidylethanolamine/phosphatidyl-N-methylethanolamine N-methyltransferase
VKDILPWFLALQRNPRQMGAILPATRALARAMAKAAVDGRQESSIIEIGAGTGRVTEALWRLSNGKMRIRAIEADKDLADRLRRRLPGIEVFSGVFEEAPERMFLGMERATVVSSVPLFSLQNDNRLAYFASLASAIKRGGVGRYVQYTYWPVLPWAGAKTLCGTDPRLVALNFPPAWIWSQDH